MIVVLLTCHPFKIIVTVVLFVLIYMINLKPFHITSNKGFGYQSMHHAWVKFAVCMTDVHHLIPSPICSAF